MPSAPAPPPSPAPASLVDARARPIVVGPLARLVLGVFFRRIEVIGAEGMPRERPLMIVANHVNGLVDPALLVGFLPVRPRFLAKSTLWANPVVRPFLRMAAAIPVYRRQDPGVDPAQNALTFAACHEVLRERGAIGLFPEGRSHNEPALVELKTGVSRIVLEAESKYPGLGARVVPVGLTFDAKGRFRSRVLVHVGEPVDPAPELELYGRDPRAAVLSLTERVRDALAEVTLNFPSWDEARLVERAADLYARPAAELPAEAALGERFALRRGVLESYERLRAGHPEAVQRVAAAVREYDARLADYRLDDAQVAAAYPASGVLRFVAKSLALMALRAPLAAVGTAIAWPPYRIVGHLARRHGESPDLPATYKVFGSLLLFPLTWILWSLAAGLAWGLGPGLGVLVLGPLSALFALRYHERRRYFQRQARAYLLLRSGRPAIEELRKLRGEVLAAVEGLAVLDQATAERAGSGSGREAGSSRSPTLEVQ